MLRGRERTHSRSRNVEWDSIGILSRADAACSVSLCILISQFGLLLAGKGRKLNDAGCMENRSGRGCKAGSRAELKCLCIMTDTFYYFYPPTILNNIYLY